MLVYEINLEENYPTSAEALDLLKEQINVAKVYNKKYVLVVHGYGSSGKGGIIRQKCRQWLFAQEKSKKIKAVVIGEDFGVCNEKARTINDKCKHELSKYYNQCNHGVTIVAL